MANIDHASDCAVHNAPALLGGVCTCGAVQTATDRDNLIELAIYHHGTEAQKADQRERFGVTYEIDAAIEQIARDALATLP